MALYAETSGDLAGSTPLVLLHGFGGIGALWRHVADLMPDEQTVIAYDLPGHGRSLVSDPGGAGRIAKAVLADLDSRGIDRVHLVGHSLGGAVATLIALRSPGRIVSLTLLAPGGFGPEINQSALLAYGEAKTVAEIRACLEPMAATGFEFLESDLVKLAAARFPAGAMDALKQVYGSLFVKGEGGGREQGMLPIGSLDTLECPVLILWGTADHILPIRQSQGLPVNCEVRQLQGVGHMVIEEAREAVVDAILSQVSTKNV